MGKPKKSVSKSPKSAEPVDLSTSLGDEEVVTMATVRSLLAVQESMLKTLFESVVNGINARMDDLESVSDIKASLEFSQTEIEDLKPLRPKLKEAEENLIRVHNSVEYLENQSRRNNIRVSGIPECPGETWNDSENKVKEAIKSSHGLEIEIERAHRVDKRKKVGGKQSKEEKEKPRTIVCKLKDWKQRESVIREARKVKPKGFYIAEALARSTLRKREEQIEAMKKARDAGKRAYFILDRLIIRDKISSDQEAASSSRE